MKKLEQKYILVKRKTRLEELTLKYNTVDQAKFYIEHMGIDFDDYLLEDRNYRTSLEQCMRILNEFGLVQLLDREHLSTYIFGDDDLVVVLGQDGLVANTLKYLEMQKVIAVNPDPTRWEGVLLPFETRQLKKIIEDTINNKRQIKEITMAKATLNDGQFIYGVNDLFIGQKSHVSSRYHFKFDEREESQSSSGIIISTGLGSTGWLKSIIAGAAGIISGYTNIAIVDSYKTANMEWNSDYLYFSVREPFKSKTTGDSLVFGKIQRNNKVVIESRMPYNGCIFSDGIENDYLEFNSGSQVTITVAERKGKLVI
ncbi:MAG: sugar kinase [Tenericutes bacterium GWF2_57_13]|nr:MAG: sugar kinase [Tenericutes bacterium GWF2_57_13]